MSTLIGQAVSLNEASRIEESLPPGKHEIRVYTTQLQEAATIQELRAVLSENGARVNSVSQGREGDLCYLSVKFTKTAPSDSISALPVAIIPLIGLVAILGMVGLGIFQLDSITDNITKLLLILGGITIVTVALLRKPIEHATSVAVKRYGG
jgi:hypothetical protein